MRAALSAYAAVFYRPLVELTLNMNWHHPYLLSFLSSLAGLSMLAGIVALLAIIDECVQRFRRRKPPAIPMEIMLPLDGLNESGPWSKPMTAVADLAVPASTPDSYEARKQAAERFNRLCEGIKDVPPKELAKRERDHFGIFGGVRPGSRRR